MQLLPRGRTSALLHRVDIAFRLAEIREGIFFSMRNIAFLNYRLYESNENIKYVCANDSLFVAILFSSIVRVSILQNISRLSGECSGLMYKSEHAPSRRGRRLPSVLQPTRTTYIHISIASIGK